MEKITFILPVHKYDSKIASYLTRNFKALNEIYYNDISVIAIGPESVMENVKELFTKIVKKFELETINCENTDFCTMVNTAVMACSTPYFSVIELDDVVLPKWPLSFCVYKDTFAPTASVFMPICQLIKADPSETDYDKLFAGFANEIAWASSFADKYGFIDKEALNGYLDYNLTGAIIKTEDFISVGSLKPEFGIVAWYEFLARLANSGQKIYVVPKCGYMHTVGREDSLMEITAKETTPEQMKALIDKALDNENNDESGN